MTNEELVSLFQQGERERIKELWEQNKGLIYKYANKFKNHLNPEEDLAQIGFLGLVKAAEGFDPTLGYKFSTYASKAIMGAMYRALYISDDISLDEERGNDGGDEGEDANLYNCIPDENAEDPEETCINTDIKRIVHQAIRENLLMPEKIVINEKHFNLMEPTFQQIADKHGVPIDVVKGIYANALKKLRQDRSLQVLINELTDIRMDSYYQFGSLSHFKTTWNSSVEEAAMKREKIRDQVERELHYLESACQ